MQNQGSDVRIKISIQSLKSNMKDEIVTVCGSNGEISRLLDLVVIEIQRGLHSMKRSQH